MRASIAAMLWMLASGGWCWSNEVGPAIELAPMPRVFDAEAVIASLIESLNDPDDEVRSYLGVALAAYGTRATPALIRALDDKSAQRRAGAAYAISQMRPTPAQALPTLLQLLRDPEEIVRRQAAYAVSRITRAMQPAVVVSEETEIPPPEPVPGARR